MLTVSKMRIPSDFELGLACATLIGCRGCTGTVRGLPWTHWRGRVVMIVFKEEILLFDGTPHSIHIWTSVPYLLLSTYIHLNIYWDVRGSGSFEQCVVFLHSRLAIVLIRLDERVLAAARDDNEDLLLEIFEQGKFDINCQDGFVSSHVLIVTERLILFPLKTV